MAPPTVPTSGASFTQPVSRTSSHTSRQLKSGSHTIVEAATCPSELKRGPDGWSFHDFKVQRILGEGSMSTVVHCTCSRSGLPVAVKMYHKERMNSLNVRQVAREIEIHASVLHPNIAKLYAAFEDGDGIYLVQELATKGDLYVELSRHGGYMLEAHVVKNVMAPFLSALSYLHDRFILHRDIKPENILLSGEGEVKVADFGLAIDTSREKPMSRVGTLDYMPPEIASLPRAGSPAPGSPAAPPALGPAPPADGGNYGLPADVWCTGILAYELLVGGPPFEADTKEATYARIIRTEPLLPPHLSEAARDFISAALHKDPAARPTVAQLQRHPWLRSPQRPRSMFVAPRPAGEAGGDAAPGSAVVAAYHGERSSGGEGEAGGRGASGSVAGAQAEEMSAQPAATAPPPSAVAAPPPSMSRAMSFGSVLAGRFAPKPHKPLSLSAIKGGSMAGGGGGEDAQPASPPGKASLVQKMVAAAAAAAAASSPRAAADSELIKAEHGSAGSIDPVRVPSLLQMLTRPGSSSGGRRSGSRILSVYLKKMSIGSIAPSKAGAGGAGEPGAAAADASKPSRLSVASKPSVAQEQQLPV